MRRSSRVRRPTLAGCVAACFCLGAAAPLAAEPAATGTASQPSSGAATVAAAKPAAKCLSDLRAFEIQMGQEGYWLGGSGYGFGYPMGGYPVVAAAAYQDARPGYEVRMLVASANILARHGKQQSCEDVLGTTRTIYKEYVADMHSEGVPTVDMPGWHEQQIAAAQPVASRATSFRSDELLGADVRDPQNEALGSVDDLVLSPKTGKIAYLVIARGGIFGIDEKYVPIPWEDFKIAPNVNLLVLDATKAAMDAAPKVNNDKFAAAGQFDHESQTVDAYWKAQLASKDEN